MKVEELESFPPKQNPYTHDPIRMGTRITTRIEAMFDDFDGDQVVLVHIPTGQRVSIDFSDKKIEFKELTNNRRVLCDMKRGIKSWQNK